MRLSWRVMNRDAARGRGPGRRTAGAAVAAGLLLSAAACGGGDGGGEATAGGDGPLKGVKVEVAAKWTGPEEANFRKVLKEFEKKTGATVTYASTGENTDAYLGPRLQANQPPDVAILPQPGLMQQYAAKGSLKPLGQDVVQQVEQNFSPYWKDLGSAEGKTYGVLIKAAYKSIMWYRPQVFSDAGVQPPATWADLVKAAGTVRDAGTTPFTLAAGPQDAWTLTDWFENVYLSQAGPEKYDQLAKHEIKWTDPSVGKALETLAEIWGKPDLLAGGVSQATKTKFDGSVTEVFGQDKAAMVYGGDFAAANIGTTKAKVGTDAKVFAFPKAGDTTPAMLGGDIAVALKEGKGAMELMKFLASPEAGKTWAGLGGYLSPNKGVAPDAYSDPVAKELIAQLQKAGDAARYDLSDLTPAAFGGTPGKGMWEALRGFVQKPDDVKGTQEKLEAEAAKAYKS
ncbi:ABC transporter substrate-binding protein [Actinomadura viridis]|uniref:ABC-type glycerol-3-phosphate transport system substrate-binding protein n=1 Tax=Actinomadura viridis TaxID=58110 RepID=A0A931GJQ2_9ACTN|nr:extracellular solute-binding protein [Actinomadura viridis]MBG6089988.1 ABC-type glycerol-3-phosphate transport system substrate-binding protein [Actinomadura viridis]